MSPNNYYHLTNFVPKIKDHQYHACSTAQSSSRFRKKKQLKFKWKTGAGMLSLNNWSWRSIDVKQIIK